MPQHSLTPLSPPAPELIFEFYFDESSEFLSPNENWVIGGYVRPRKPSDSPSASDRDAEKWWNSVWTWFQKTYPGYVGIYKLAHCSPNRTNPYRKSIQPAVLEILLKNISDVDGFPVVFFCPRGSYNWENKNVNYFSVLAHGYIQLVDEISRRFPDNPIRIIPIASKTTATDDFASSTTSREMSILKHYYINLLSFYSRGRSDVLYLQRAFNDLKIIHGAVPPIIDEHGRPVPNPSDIKMNLHNTLADYICNSYYANIGDARNTIKNQKNSFICTVLRDSNPLSIPKEDQSTDESTLRSKPADLQDIFCADMIDQFNASTLDEQRLIIHKLCNEIKPRIEKQREMEALLDKLDVLLKTAEHISLSVIQAEMTANLLLFKLALLNHIGDTYSIDSLSKDFIKAVSKIPDDFSRNTLLSMFSNRHIVLNTDFNDYEKAEEHYLYLEEYWDKHLTQQTNHLKGFCNDFSQNLSNIICPEYSKAIGSILQTARHRMRLSPRAERFSIYLTALNRARIARIHISEPSDLSRIEQTLCDLDSEAAFYDSAFHHLWQAAQLLSDTPEENTAPAITVQTCTQILDIAGEHGCSNPFLLSHYTRLISELMIYGSDSALNLVRAKTMLNALLQQKHALDPSAYQCINSIHPRTQILWKLGSAAFRSGMESEGNSLLTAAFEQLSSSSSGIFYAIAISVRAEQAYLNHADAQMITNIRTMYAKFLEEKPMEMLDPFEKNGIDFLSASNSNIRRHLLEISRVIAY